MKTVLITGCSTGIGRATAKLFYAQGWNVIATMRSPEKEKEFNKYDGRMMCLKLDVTDPVSIANAFEVGVRSYSKIDVVVNNAGYGLIGFLESLSYEQIDRQVQTNVTGLIEVSRNAVKQFRLQNSGTLINVASVVGKVAVPLYSIYCATKFAVEGFSEALQFELASINARVKIVEPGTTHTDFFGRSSDRPDESNLPEVYRPYQKAMNAQMEKYSKIGMTSEAVAHVVLVAANDSSSKLRYTVGFQNGAVMAFRKLAPDFLYRAIVALGTKS